jgi:hypothetical protein
MMSAKKECLHIYLSRSAPCSLCTEKCRRWCFKVLLADIEIHSVKRFIGNRSSKTNRIQINTQHAIVSSWQCCSLDANGPNQVIANHVPGLTAPITPEKAPPSCFSDLMPLVFLYTEISLKRYEMYKV